MKTSTRTTRKYTKRSKKLNPHSALAIVRRFSPKVTKVYDATEPLMIEVTQRDANSKAVKNHGECAMAVACKRSLKLDGVIIARRTAYMIKGDTAYRYEVSNSVGREITAFDRGAAFEPGTYRLGIACHKLGEQTKQQGSGKHGNRDGQTELKRFRHITENIRTPLNNENVA